MTSFLSNSKINLYRNFNNIAKQLLESNYYQNLLEVKASAVEMNIFRRTQNFTYDDFNIVMETSC